MLALAGKVHGSLARAGKVRGQTPKVAKADKKKNPKGRAAQRIKYNRRFVNVGALQAATRTCVPFGLASAHASTYLLKPSLPAPPPPPHPPPAERPAAGPFLVFLSVR